MRFAKNNHGYLKVKFVVVSKLTKLCGITRMTSKKGTSFQKAHALDFAFKIVSTDAHGDVTV